MVFLRTSERLRDKKFSDSCRAQNVEYFEKNIEKAFKMAEIFSKNDGR
jgi:hypothetical protein